ncbi:YycH family regulatory protein [Alkalicoccobacillus porphyridii]|uniref:Regulatory protein YycH domain-containing protein n=1 Tax=Alkalicoccobacillus porphyridii TaxID=2597270 RepID=A0A554A1G5_9BACI|nr:two-component system activity regulator YycH [Alkalicoccobacillus porphyridii]TSB47515.1 hypothetical protein FN960_07200 [Alkalicoccobacillus porphyridii]
MVRGLCYERLKTWALIILVAISLLLTWRLWTYEPDIADQNSEAVEFHPIGEEKSVRDVVRPNKVVKHQADETTIVLESESTFDQIYDRLLDAELYDINYSPRSDISTGIEIVFPDTVPMNMFMNLFSNNQESEEENFPLVGVDRLLLYEDTNGQAQLQVYSRTDDDAIQIGLSLSGSDVTRFLEEDNSVAALTVNDANEDQSILTQQNIYIPAEPVEVNRQSYSTERVSTNDINRLLFPDTDSVRRYRQSNGELSYTDGSRIINLRDNENFMTYRNSSSTDSNSPRTSIPESSFDYINSHAGWTNDYVLSWWRASSNDREYAVYRLYMNDLPIYNIKNSSDSMTLNVERNGSQTTNYIRPLLILDSSPINEVSIMLESGEDLITRLQEGENVNMNTLRDVRIGYEMTDDEDQLGLVTLEPAWFILADNGWEKVSFTEEGNQ